LTNIRRDVVGKRDRERIARIRAGDESPFMIREWEREERESMLASHRAYLLQSEKFLSLCCRSAELAEEVYNGKLSLNEAWGQAGQA
jgi:hypothetical protein